MRMFVRFAILALLFIVSSNETFAQNGRIKGAISLNGEPAASIQVILVKEYKLFRETRADGKGKFVFEDIPAGVYPISFKYSFTDTKSYENVKVEANKTTEMKIEIRNHFYRKDAEGVFFLYKEDEAFKVNIKIIE